MPLHVITLLLSHEHMLDVKAALDEDSRMQWSRDTWTVGPWLHNVVLYGELMEDNLACEVNYDRNHTVRDL